MRAFVSVGVLAAHLRAGVVGEALTVEYVEVATGEEVHVFAIIASTW